MSVDSVVRAFGDGDFLLAGAEGRTEKGRDAGENGAGEAGGREWWSSGWSLLAWRLGHGDGGERFCGCSRWSKWRC